MLIYPQCLSATATGAEARGKVTQKLAKDQTFDVLLRIIYFLGLYDEKSHKAIIALRLIDILCQKVSKSTKFSIDSDAF